MTEQALFTEDQLKALPDVTRLLVNAYRMISPKLLEHSQDLAKTCKDVAIRLGWDEQMNRAAFLGGLFHDVGYLASPMSLKDWQADESPSADMENEHPLLGEKLLQQVGCLQPILPVVRYHHEHWDGTGFPDGLKGEQVPKLARLVSVVHEYQTLVRGHGTTDPMNPDEAREVILEDAGVTLDPNIVDAFLKYLDEKQAEEAGQPQA